MIFCSCCTLKTWAWSCGSHNKHDTAYIYCDIIEIKIDYTDTAKHGRNRHGVIEKCNGQRPTKSNTNQLQAIEDLSKATDQHPRLFKFLTFSNIYKAGAILLCKNKVLLVQSRGNKWGFPKGTIMPGETVLGCAKREVKEETSLDVDLTENDRLSRSFGHTVLYFKEIKNPSVNMNNIIKHGEDCSGIGWIRVYCLKKEVLSNNTSFTASLKSIVNYYL